MTIIEKSDTAQIRVDVAEFKGRQRLDVREYFLPEGGKDWMPTKRGINVLADKAGELIEAIKTEGGLS